MKKILILLLLIFVSTATCFSAEGIVTADTGDCNIRVSHDLDAEAVGVLYQGESAPYAGGIYKDDRGVDWYSIEWDGEEYWVSSRYTNLEIDGEVYQNASDAESETVGGNYTGEFGYTAVIDPDSQTITVTDPEGSINVSCDYELKKDGEGFLYVNDPSGASFYQRTCLGENVVLYYYDNEFVDMLTLQ